MPGFGQDDPPLIPVPPPALPVVVCRYSEPAEEGGDGSFFLLPNIRWLSTQHRDWVPHVARYRYEFDPASFAPDPQTWGSFPTRWEQVYPYDAQGDFVVKQDDRLLAFVLWEDGTWQCVADGYAQAPQVDCDHDAEHVTFECAGFPWLQWVDVVRGALYRDGDASDDPPDPPDDDAPDNHLDVETDGPARFNPSGQPNMTSTDTEGKLGNYPAFFDHRLILDPDVRLLWKLGPAVRWLMYYTPSLVPDMSKGITFPEPTTVDDLLRLPADTPGGDTKAITVQDVDVQGMAWPDAVHRLSEPHVFALRFDLLAQEAMDGPLLPEHRIILYDRNAGGTTKQVYQQAPGVLGSPTWLDLNATNAPSLSIQRDSRSIENYWLATTALDLYELCVVLQPAFQPVAGDDADATVRGKFDPINPAFTTGDNSDRYRKWVAAEASQRFWQRGVSEWKTTPLDLASVLQPDDPSNDDHRTYARVPRPGRHDLLTTDSAGKPRKAILYISRDYQGLGVAGKWNPVIWDREDTAHWQEVHDGWQLLDDQLGIRITAKDLHAWDIGKPTADERADPKLPFKNPVVNVIHPLSDPDLTGTPGDPAHPYTPIFFKLLTVIEGDHDIPDAATDRTASPSHFRIVRLDDTKDRFLRQHRHKSSPLGTGAAGDGGGDEEILYDDSDRAKIHAENRRRAHELAKHAGRVTIPWISSAYLLGDKVDRVKGRDVSLNELAGTEGGEPGVYPAIVGIDFSNDGGQHTVLQLGDARSEPAVDPRHGKAFRKRMARERSRVAGLERAAAAKVAAGAVGIGAAPGLVTGMP